MMKLIYFFFFISIFTVVSVETIEIIKVGMLMPVQNSLLVRDFGMYNSYGVIPLVMDRIVGEKLLNNYNFT